MRIIVADSKTCDVIKQINDGVVKFDYFTSAAE